MLDELKKYESPLKNVSSSSSLSASSLINRDKDQHQILAGNNRSLAEYTLMVYMVGSDLEAKSYSATKNIQEMESIGSTSDINIIIQTGGGNDKTTPDGKRFIDFTKVQRHKILHNNIETLADLGHQNMGDPHTLSDFIRWGASNFPAKKYAIILWDHGSGINGFGGDLVFNNDQLTVDELHQAFADAVNLKKRSRMFELIGFDSCLMASVEVANSIKSFGNFMISSEEIEPQWGWNYSSILRHLAPYPNLNGSSLGKIIANSFFEKVQSISLSKEGYNAQREITASVINLTKVPELVMHLDNLADYIGNKIADFGYVTSLATSADSADHYGQTFKGSSGLVDAYGLVFNIKQLLPQSSNLVYAVEKSLNDTVVYKKNGDASHNANGLSIYMPIKEEEFTDARRQTLPSWQRIIDLQYNLTKNDHSAPVIQSNAIGDTIRGHVYASDVAKVTLWIYTNLCQKVILLFTKTLILLPL